MNSFSHSATQKNKSTRTECFCALCRSPRVIRYSRRLRARHYIQILTLALGVSAVGFSSLGFKGIYSLPLVWAVFEIYYKSLYRKDLKCPYCGFDPTWYKKDIKLARQKVEEFLKQNPNSPILNRGRQGNGENFPIKTQ